MRILDPLILPKDTDTDPYSQHNTSYLDQLSAFKIRVLAITGHGGRHKSIFVCFPLPYETTRYRGVRLALTPPWGQTCKQRAVGKWDVLGRDKGGE